jgi:large subunit ribosomal protein L17
LITKTKKTDSKEEISHNHRVVFSYLNDKAAVKELFTVVAPKIATRPGGYTRIIKLGIRPGDNAEKALIELVDFNEIYGNSIASATEPAKKTRRSKSTAAPKVAAATPVEAAPAEAVVTEEATTEEAPEASAEVANEAPTEDANDAKPTAE